MKNSPLLSVVIPVYNTEEYFDRCIKSLESQTYKNMELIVVDDCSPGNIKDLIKVYKKLKIKFVSHKENMGLFQARVSGSEQATGDYICFVDSDDHVSQDFYRTMIQKAEEKKLDIVAGTTIFEKPDGTCFVRNHHEMCFGSIDLHGDEVGSAFFSQKMTSYVWHTIWNKIYKKSLWDSCLPSFKKMKDPVIMTEDVAFSSLLFFNANGFGYIPNEGYHYCENSNSSTNSEDITFKKFSRNLQDMTTVFDFVETYLKGKNADPETTSNFKESRKYYSRMWRSLQESRFVTGPSAKKSKELIDKFLPGYKELRKVNENYLETTHTFYDSTIENIKKIISDPEIEVVSFDMFDTLVLRPLYAPSDIFILMEERYKELVPDATASFSTMRTKCEEELRSRWWRLHPKSEDFGITDIYKNMQELYNIPPKIVDKMCELEKNLEIELCHTRETAKDLYNLAHHLKKKIVIISDMYLDRPTIEKILKKNGYDKHKEIFLSCEEELTKYSGKLFEAAIKDLDVESDKIVHIGDNWNNDFLKSKEYGMVSVFLPKPIESFDGKIQNVKTNNCGKMGELTCDVFISEDGLRKSFGYRTMIAMIANRHFDNPYISFNGASDLDASPSFTGYYPVGMHLMGICKKLYEMSKEKKSKRIAFLARDGYLPMAAMRVISKYIQLPEIEYVRCSRQALMPWMIGVPSDLFDLPIEPLNHTPSSLMEMLSFCCDKTPSKNKGSKARGINWDVRFESRADFLQFIKFFIENYYSEKELEASKSTTFEYYNKMLPENTLVFDMGYSGRIPAALNSMLKRKLDFLYVYKDETCNELEERMGIEINVMYPASPNISGFFREYILSDTSGQCTGFSKKEGVVEPILETRKTSFIEDLILEILQSSAVQFVEDFMESFKDNTTQMNFDPMQVSLPFEGYLKRGSDFDRRLFGASYFDDFVYGGTEKINVYDLWGQLVTNRTTTREAMARPANVRDELSSVLLEFFMNENNIDALAYRYSTSPKIKSMLTKMMSNMFDDGE
jgi:haloacid dehalogenase superfamily, subfamily IA, variant 1 with third motif having Dx(3-4)D or Dx(3-4)E